MGSKLTNVFIDVIDITLRITLAIIIEKAYNYIKGRKQWLLATSIEAIILETRKYKLLDLYFDS